MYALFVGIPGGPELLVILGIAVLLFGADKLPNLARSGGQAMGEFKKGRQDIENEIRAGAAESATEEEAETAEENPAVDATADRA